MIQCQDCKYFHRDEGGQISFECDPFSTIVEPECLLKWQMIKINQMVGAYQATLAYYRKLEPLQEKIFKVMEREIDSMDEGEQWKVADEDEEEDDQEDTEPDKWDTGEILP